MENKNQIDLMNEELERQIDSIKLFWKNEYPSYSHEEKIGYWAGSINQQMRFQAESGLDEYAVFTPNWHKWVLEREPNFDAIMDEAFEKFLSWEWDKKRYLEKIKADK